MKFSALSLLIAQMTALALAAPASAEPRTFTGFDSVQVQDNIVVDVRTGPQFAIDVSGPEAARVMTRLQGRQLRIWERDRPWFGPDRRVNATVHVTMPSVSGLSAARGASLTAEDITAANMALSAAMGADLRITGVCQGVDVSAAMGGTVYAEGFQCATASISAAMGGDARVFASRTFDASAAMGGDVVIHGGAHGDTSAAMGGSIRIVDGGKADHRSAVMGGEVSEN